jgi:hypothetical protein
MPTGGDFTVPLYHRRVLSRPVVLLAFLALLVSLAPLVVIAGGPVDRLERFRFLARTRLGPVEILDAERSPEIYREIYALLDEEMVDSVASGGVFASVEFLQERLDGFAETWGGASLKVVRAGPLAIGAFHLGRGSDSVRLYGRVDGEAGLLKIIQGPGRPVVHTLPPAPDGAPQFVVAWEGPLSGRGSRALRLDLLRQTGEDARVMWTSTDLFPDGLFAREYSVRGREIVVRYEIHYAGWNPGCELQTEQEDVYRLTPTGVFARAGRQQHNAWHLALHRTVDGLLEAVAGRDGAALAALVPDRGLRERLPRTLEREPACDAPDASNPTTVSVAAVADERRPWTLTFQRSPRGWRLVSAAPVIP